MRVRNSKMTIIFQNLTVFRDFFFARFGVDLISVDFLGGSWRSPQETLMCWFYSPPKQIARSVTATTHVFDAQHTPSHWFFPFILRLWCYDNQNMTQKWTALLNGSTGEWWRIFFCLVLRPKERERCSVTSCHWLTVDERRLFCLKTNKRNPSKEKRTIQTNIPLYIFSRVIRIFDSFRGRVCWLFSVALRPTADRTKTSKKVAAFNLLPSGSRTSCSSGVSSTPEHTRSETKCLHLCTICFALQPTCHRNIRANRSERIICRRKSLF